MSSYPPPPADAADVLPGEDGGAYASRKAEAAAIADAARLPEWVLLAEVARRRRNDRAAGGGARETHRALLIAEGFCMADDDGDCTWEGCRQNDPKTREPHCPRDIATRRLLDPNDEGRAGNG